MKIIRTEVIVETEQIVITRQSTPHELICPECGEKIVVERGKARSGGFAKGGHRKPCQAETGIDLSGLDPTGLRRERSFTLLDSDFARARRPRRGARSKG